MRRLKLVSLAILLCSVLLFGYCKARQIRTDDDIAPVIQMDETTIEVGVEDGEEVLLSGVTAEDNKDGDVSSSLIIDNISDFTEDGTRFVTIAAFDSSSNVGKAIREITYRDYTIPRFEFLEPMRFQIGDTDYLENVTVTDCLEGDISSLVRFSDNTEITVDEAGEYKVELQVRNNAGDTEYLPFTLEILEASDYNMEPQIYLKKYVAYTKKGKKIDYKKNLDSVTIAGVEYELTDGNEWTEDSIGKDKIRVNDKGVDYKTPGVYEVTYSLTLENDNDDDDGEEVKGTVRLVIVVEE